MATSSNHTRSSRSFRILFPLVIVLWAALAYANSLHAPFVFDDIPDIVENASIRSLEFRPELFFPPGTGLATRPLVNLTLAANYAIGGLNPYGYHLVNLTLHLFSALLLYGIIRRTLENPGTAPRFGAAAVPVAGFAALIWAVHPLNTQAVTYVIQRCESQMALFYLGTVYLAVRGFQSRKRLFWHLGAVVCFLLGAATKEVIITAPFLILLYDLVFVGPGLMRALKKSPTLYAGLALGIAGQLAFVFSMVDPGGVTASHYFTWAEYARTQPGAILHYLRLVFWPSPLVFDYWQEPAPWGRALVSGAALLILVAGTLWGLFRRKPWAFALAWFFAILAPSSSFYPLNNLMYEHRAYLSSAGITALVAAGAWWLASRLSDEKRRVTGGVLFVLGVAAAASLFVLTRDRNRDYQSEQALWEDTLAKRPDNPRALDRLGVLAMDQGKLAEAEPYLARAVALAPDVAVFQYNLGSLRLKTGRPVEAVEHLEKAVGPKGNFYEALVNLGTARAMAGDMAGAADAIQKAVAVQPGSAEARQNLGKAWLALNRPREAAFESLMALRLNPWLPEAMLTGGMALAALGQPRTASGLLQKAYRLDSDNLRAKAAVEGLSRKMAAQKEKVDALARSLGENGGDFKTRLALGRVYAEMGLDAEAARHLETAVRMNPDSVGALNELGLARLHQNQIDEARTLFRKALGLSPESPVTTYNLACLHSQIGNIQEAMSWLEKSVEYGVNDPILLLSDPDLTAVRNDPRFPYLLEMLLQNQGPY